jgi:hypothetical protein
VPLFAHHEHEGKSARGVYGDVVEEMDDGVGRLRAALAELGPQDSPLGSDRWAIVTLALANGLALERLIDPGGVPGDLLGAVQTRIARG